MTDVAFDYLKPTPQASSFLYTDTNVSNNVPRFHVMLTMEVNAEVLSQAFCETLERYPQFAVGVCRNEDSYVFKKLQTKPEVYFEDGIPVTLGTAETNEYLVRVSYQGRYVYMDFHHSLGDGLSFIQVMNTMLYRYFELLGLPIKNDGTITTVHTPCEEGEWANPYDGLEARANPYNYEDQKNYKAFIPEGCGTSNNQPNTVVQIRMPFIALRGAAKQFQTSPVTFISPLFSGAIYQIHKNEIKEQTLIVTGIPINLRSHRPSISTQYYIATGKLIFGKQFVDNMETTELFKAGKQLLDLQTNTDFLLYKAWKEENAVKALHNAPLNAKQKKARVTEGTIEALQDFTYVLTNMGNIKLPSTMEQYVMEYYPVLPTAMSPYTIAVTAYKGEMILSVAQRFYNLDVCNRFVELMNQVGIPAYIAKVSEFCTTRYDG